MSTRALYTFKDADSSWNVYKHSDGYPRGAANVLQTAIDFFAWQLPRFEADEFAAAFIAAGKATWLWGSKLDKEGFKEYSPGGKYRAFSGGGVRLMPQGDPLTVASENCSDIKYRYEISMGNDNQLRVRAYSVNAWSDQPAETLLTDCKMSSFAQWAREDDERAA